MKDFLMSFGGVNSVMKKVRFFRELGRLPSLGIKDHTVAVTKALACGLLRREEKDTES